MTQKITAQLLKGGLTVDASGNISATKLIGNLQGNVTGDVTGDLLGDVTGDLTGNVTDLKTGTIKASDSTLAITIADSTGKVTLAGDLEVGGTVTAINTALTISDAMVINNAGTDVGIKVNSTSTGHIMQLQDNGTDVLVVEDGGQVGIGTATPGSALTIAGATSNLATFTSDLTIAASYSMAIIGPVTIPNVTVNGNLNIMSVLNVTGNLNISSTGFMNIIG